MCTIEITGVFGVDVQSDGSAGSIRVEGTVVGCPTSEEYALPGGPPRALVTVSVPDITGAVAVEEVYLDEEGNVDFFVFLKGVFRCETVQVSAWCGAPGSECGVEHEEHMVVCGPNCPDMELEVSYGGCENGKRIVNVTASWDGFPEWGNAGVFWGANQQTIAGFGGVTQISVALPFGPGDVGNKIVGVDLFPGCAHSIEFPVVGVTRLELMTSSL